MSELKCDHCQEIVKIDYQLKVGDKIKHFCCTGCQHVYQILNQNNLTQFYSLSANERIDRPADKIDDYTYLDDEQFKANYLINNEFEFYVEGVHCIACLWLLEKLPELVSGVITSKLNMSTGVVTLNVSEDVKLSEVAAMIARLGYRPHPLMQKDDAKKLQEKENQKSLIQIAVAFACAGNIMLYALAIYAGAEGTFKQYFNLFSFVCIVPIVFYSSIPFYRSAFGAIKSRTLSIDIPIVIAIVIGFLMGGYSLIFGGDHFYFDTIATLVFLLLSARYILKRMQQKSLGQTDLQAFFANKSAIQIINGQEKSVLTSFLKIGDTVKVLPNTLLPIDGEVITGNGLVNNSLITGEVYPVEVKAKDEVFMGAKNVGDELLVKVTKLSSETRLGKILKQIEAGWRSESRISLIADKISKRFVGVVFTLATIFMLYFGITQGASVAIERTLTLLLITCPCALALTTPMALILGLSQMARQGVIIKNELVLENLTRAKKIFLDKTGTLTSGEFTITANDELTQEQVDLIFTLESYSNHPIAKSLIRFLKKEFKPHKIEMSKLTEIPGKGVEGSYLGHIFSVKTVFGADQKQCGLFQDDKLLVSFNISDEVNPNSLKAVAGLKKLGVSPVILSGDEQEYVANVANELKVSQFYAAHSPEQKNALIAQEPDAIMVGDGINDALALKSANVGVAVRGSVDVALRAADVYLSRSSIDHILGIISGSKHVLNIIYRNLAFSLGYNLLGVYLAWTGLVSPLVAAILMPLSSITVLISTLIGTKRLKNLIS